MITMHKAFLSILLQTMAFNYISTTKGQIEQ